GLTTWGHSRYLFPALILLLGLGLREAVAWVGSLSPRHARRATGAALLAVAAAWALVLSGLARQDERARASLRGVLTAAAAIRQDAAGRPCTVLGRQATQLEWYSGCRATLDLPRELLAQRRVYAVVLPAPEQPPVESFPGRHQVVLARPGLATVTRLDPERP
ncbi:MAG TPA: hypothetical protein PKU97_25195, partial [Kofleriaceae bacterium]|nr:hypothetical protein [Kofleriaceae bacterium]